MSNQTKVLRPVPSIAVASHAERSTVFDLAAQERVWYEQAEVYETNDHIAEAADQGKLVKVEADDNLALIGRLRNPEFQWRLPPFLLPDSALALKAIGKLWRIELESSGIDLPGVRLAVTSLVRSEQTQLELLKDPTKLAASDSTHCVGAAFDIDASAYYYLQAGQLVSVPHPERDRAAVKNIAGVLMDQSDNPYIMQDTDSEFDPRITQALVTVTTNLHELGLVNRIVEFGGTSNQCVHTAPNPVAEFWSS